MTRLIQVGEAGVGFIGISSNTRSVIDNGLSGLGSPTRALVFLLVASANWVNWYFGALALGGFDFTATGHFYRIAVLREMAKFAPAGIAIIIAHTFRIER